MKNFSPTTNWMEYKYKKIMGPFDFEKAKLLEEQTLCCSTNDDTDGIIEQSQENIGGKRHKKPKKFSSDESLNEEESDDSVTSEIKSKRKRIKKNSDNNLRNLKMPLKPNPKSDGKNNNVIPPVITPINNNHSTPEGIIVDEVDEITNETNENEAQSDFTSIPGTSNESTGLNEKKQRREKNKMTSILENMKKEIMRAVRRNKVKELLVNELVNGEEADIEEDDEFENTFPLTTVEDLNKFDAILKVDADTRKKLKMKFQKIDGPTITRHTNNCLQRIMTNDLAVLYSYSGQSRGQK
ncbi:hypothetical protein TSAR_000088 [Trichomalopsis sarcophagae]|uniref:DUF4806 domain-containing protein n=1 Tax=Trichomalopsis sarcophagae TaxID=543379 RepID=A0A232ELI3_9HYME|nr:hypothetical protein TSAR_000088 [Trichomalopsis sarcophagae]